MGGLLRTCTRLLPLGVDVSGMVLEPLCDHSERGSLLALDHRLLLANSHWPLTHPPEQTLWSGSDYPNPSCSSRHTDPPSGPRWAGTCIGTHRAPESDPFRRHRPPEAKYDLRAPARW